jgi:hypothetical protein
MGKGTMVDIKGKIMEAKHREKNVCPAFLWWSLLIFLWYSCGKMMLENAKVVQGSMIKAADICMILQWHHQICITTGDLKCLKHDNKGYI